MEAIFPSLLLHHLQRCISSTLNKYFPLFLSIANLHTIHTQQTCQQLFDKPTVPICEPQSSHKQKTKIMIKTESEHGLPLYRENYSQKEINRAVRYACNVQNCKGNFSVRQSTSTLRGHLNDHVFYLEDKQLIFTSTFCLVDAGLPFATVENDIFKEMIRICDTNINVPTSIKVSKELIEIQKSHEVTVV